MVTVAALFEKPSLWAELVRLPDTTRLPPACRWIDAAAALRKPRAAVFLRSPFAVNVLPAPVTLMEAVGASKPVPSALFAKSRATVRVPPLRTSTLAEAPGPEAVLFKLPPITAWLPSMVSVAALTPAFPLVAEIFKDIDRFATAAFDDQTVMVMKVK